MYLWFKLSGLNKKKQTYREPGLEAYLSTKVAQSAEMFSTVIKQDKSKKKTSYTAFVIIDNNTLVTEKYSSPPKKTGLKIL